MKINRIKIENKILSATILLVLILSVFVFSTPNVFAAFNEQINYQGKLTNASNSAVANGSYNIRFNLYTSATGGSPIWTETWCYSSDNGATCTGAGTDNRIALANGLFSTLLGSTTSLSGVDFNQTLYLGVEIGGSNATPSWDGEMTPRKKLGAVPAALVSKTLDGIRPDQFIRGDIANSTSSATTFLSIAQNGAGKVAEFIGNTGASALAILSNGNVGIGTTSPYAKLSVQATAGDSTPLFTIASSTNGTGTTTALYVAANGNVGIGTIAPSNKLSVSGGYIDVNGTTGGYKIDNRLILQASSTNSSTLVGYEAGKSLLASGKFNTAIGEGSLSTATSSNYNTAVGFFTLYFNESGANNSAFGFQTLRNNTTGSENSAFGSNTLDQNTTGSSNSAFGYSALYLNTAGLYNSAFGNDSLTYNETGSGNTANGYQSLYNSLGNYNTSIGYKAGHNITTASSTIIIGANVAAPSAIADGQLNIGNILYGTGLYSGSTLSSAPTSAGKIGIGTTSPYAKLSVQATAGDSTPLFAIASSTNGAGTTTAFYVAANGNVGIGTAAPGSRLSVGSSFSVSSAGAVTAASVYSGNYMVNDTGGFDFQTRGLIRATANGVFKFSNSSATDFTRLQFGGTSSSFPALSISTSTSAYGSAIQIIGADGSSNANLLVTGNVGIGTTSPYAKLSVVGPVVAEYFRATSTTATSTFAGGLSVAGTSGLTVLQNGNIGIGTTSPIAKLDVTSSDEMMGLRLINNGAGVNDSNIRLVNTTAGTNQTRIDFQNNVGTSADSGATLFYTASNYGSGYNSTVGLWNYQAGNIILATNGTERLRIDSAGNVGIGTINPNNLFQVLDLIDFNNTDQNSKLGYQAGKNILSGAQYNTFLGYQAGFSSSTASTNLADNNTGIGYDSLYSNTSGFKNTSNGALSLYSNTTGYENTANGYLALYSNNAGYANTANGSRSLLYNTTGYNNAGYGVFALYSNNTGFNNTAIGVNAGYSTLGSNNVMLGFRAGSYETGTSTFYVDAFDRGSSANEKANALLYGTFDATSAANQNLTVNAHLNVMGTSTFTSTTSQTTSNTLGINNILTQSAGGASHRTIGMYGSTTYDGITDEHYLAGIMNGVTNSGTGIITNVVGGYDHVAVTGANSTNVWGSIGEIVNAGHFNKMMGIGSYVTNTSADVTNNDMYGYASTITNSGVADGASGFQLDAYNTGTLTDLHGLQIDLYTAGGTTGTVMGIDLGSAHNWTGTPTNSYGIYIDPSTNIGTNTNYSIYSGSLANSYFAGNVGIGTTSPWRSLSVTGSSDLGNNALAGYFTATSTNASTFVGNIGIGTTSPMDALTILGDDKFIRLNASSEPSSYYSRIGQHHDQTNAFQIFQNTNQIFGSSWQGFYTFTQPTWGTFGVGTTTPTAVAPYSINSNKFVVQGDSLFYGAIDFLTQKNIRTVFEGDSITGTCFNSTMWPSYFASSTYVASSSPILARATPYNYGACSDTVLSMQTEYATQGHTVRPVKSSDEAYFFLLGGTNDIYLNSPTSAQLFGYITNVLGQARADGFKVVAMTIMPSILFNPTMETTRLEVNQMILNNPQLFDYIIDTAKILPNFSDTRYFSDGTHPTALGSLLIANAVAKAMGKYQPYMLVNSLANATTTDFSTENLVLNPQGLNVGIGTTSPYAKLSVVGEVVASHYTATTTATSTFRGNIQINGNDNSEVQAITLNNSAANAGQLNSIRFLNGSLNGSAAIKSRLATGGGSASLGLFAGAGVAGGTERLTIDGSTGYIGIGTTSPVATLGIQGSIGVNASQLYLGSNGNVGINNTNPASNYNLDVTGSIRATTQGVFPAIYTTALYDSGSGTNASIGFGGANKTLSFATDGTSRLFIGATGNVGIGTTSPYAKLSVVGPVVAEYFHATSTTATSTFAGGFVSTGMSIFDNITMGALNFETNAGTVSWVDLPIDSLSADGTVQSYSAQMDSQNVLTIFGQANGSGAVKNIRTVVGTTTDAVLTSANIPYSSLLVTDGALCVDNGAGNTCASSARTRGYIYAEGSSLAGLDLAEQYRSTDVTLSAGDVLMVDPANPLYVSRYNRDSVSTSSEDLPAIIGVVSTEPGVLLGGYSDDSPTLFKVPVGLSGRVPVKISLENGPIKIGDRISPAKKPGYAAKALDNEASLGIALEAFNDNTASSSIVVFLDKQIAKTNTSVVSTSPAISVASTSYSYSDDSSSDYTASSSGIVSIYDEDQNNAINDITTKINGLTATTNNISSSTATLAAAIDALGKATSTLASTTANELASSTSFIQTIAVAVTEWLKAAGNLVVNTFSAKIAYFERVEADVVAISKGMELKDQATGTIYCVSIINGEWVKNVGSCTEVAATSTTPIVNNYVAPENNLSAVNEAISPTTPITPTIPATTTSATSTTATSTLENTTITDVATSTDSVATEVSTSTVSSSITPVLPSGEVIPSQTNESSTIPSTDTTVETVTSTPEPADTSINQVQSEASTVSSSE